MRSYIFLFLFIAPTALYPMKIKKNYLEPVKESQLLQAALTMLHTRNPSYKLFNRSNERELRDLHFLLPHLKKNTVKEAHLLHNRTEELRDIYLITLKHIDCLSTAQTIEKYFLIDLKRLYIVHLHHYPTSIEEKIEALASYYQKISLNFPSLIARIPQEYCDFFKTIFCRLLTVQDYAITNVIFLDKSDEAGYFVLFRLVDQHMHLVKEVVYNLRNKKNYVWDKRCGNIKEYYAKYQKFFIKQGMIV